MKKYLVPAIALTLAGCSLPDESREQRETETQRDGGGSERAMLEAALESVGGAELVCGELYSYGINSMSMFYTVENEYWRNVEMAYENASNGVPFTAMAKDIIMDMVRTCF